MNFSIKIFNHIKLHKVRYFSIFILVITISVYLGVYIYIREYRNPKLGVHFFSLKRGRSVFVRTPENKTMLIGGGQNSEVIREITKVMPFYSRRIDYVFIPSATPAQIGGLLEIIDRYSIGQIVMPKIMATSTVFTQLLKKVNKNKIHINEVERGDEIFIGNGKDIREGGSLKISILFPLRDFKYTKTSLPELGLVISYRNTNVYLLGNLSKTIQKYIARTMKDEKDNLNKNSENIIEFYNSAIQSKVSSELIGILNPRFIFSTKEIGTNFYSDGYTWLRKE